MSEGQYNSTDEQTVTSGGHGMRHIAITVTGRRVRDSLQFSSSLPSGQSLKPLQRKRPMMQWTPLAQAKNEGAHFDLALAKNR